MYRSTTLFSSGRDTGIALIATRRRTPALTIAARMLRMPWE